MGNREAGERFGFLEVVADEGAKILFRCDCGKEKRILRASVLRGMTQSCGCMRGALVKAHKTKHGHAKTASGAPSPTYRSWSGMLQRCLSESNPQWPEYGGRGIAVADRWTSFDAFLTDMGVRPDGTTLDRIDVNGNYEPGNCRWATAKQQANNRRPRRWHRKPAAEE